MEEIEVRYSILRCSVALVLRSACDLRICIDGYILWNIYWSLKTFGLSVPFFASLTCRFELVSVVTRQTNKDTLSQKPANTIDG